MCSLVLPGCHLSRSTNVVDVVTPAPALVLLYTGGYYRVRASGGWWELGAYSHAFAYSVGQAAQPQVYPRCQELFD